jgi:hypothetical protein
MRFKIWLAIFLAFGVSHTLQATIAKPVMVLTAVENGLEAQENFTCYGKIHGYIRLPQRQSNAHVLESRWISPNGKVAADSRTKVDFKPARSTAYVWFAFPENSTMLGASDPELEQDRLTFNGTWHVEIRWDEQPLIKEEFKVRCP